MCPVCLATAAIIAGSATGTGGLAALVARTLRRTTGNSSPTRTAKEVFCGRHTVRSTSPPDRLAR
jgi:hypothetical protein